MEKEITIENSNKTRENQIEELRKTISAQYSELDVLNNTLQTTTDITQRRIIEQNYWEAGIVFRGSVVFAFSLLDDIKTKENKEIYLQWNKELDTNSAPFETLAKARAFRNISRLLLKAMIEETLDIKTELELEKI